MIYEREDLQNIDRNKSGKFDEVTGNWGVDFWLEKQPINGV